MNIERQNPSTPRPKSGLGRRLLIAFLEGADEALRDARRDDQQAAEDDQCRLRPDYSRMTRGYRETG